MFGDILQEMVAAQQEAAVKAVILCEAEHGGARTCDDFFRYWYGSALGRWGTHTRDLPWAAEKVIFAECLTPDATRELVISAWTHPEFPEANLGQRKWLKIFRRVGFLTDLEDGEVVPATESVQVWRGAIPSRSRGMAWTTDRDRAKWFASRFDEPSSGEEGAVWTTTATPNQILAFFANRGESEFVLNPKNLAIERVPR